VSSRDRERARAGVAEHDGGHVDAHAHGRVEPGEETAGAAAELEHAAGTAGGAELGRVDDAKSRLAAAIAVALIVAGGGAVVAGRDVAPVGRRPHVLTGPGGSAGPRDRGDRR